MIKQLPINFEASHKSDVRSQFAALCYRQVQDQTEVLLITARNSGRWVVPKGWPMDGMTPADIAAQEAWEEAGVIGKPFNHCLGLFSYSKSIGDEDVPVMVMVYPVRVDSLAGEFPEAGQRERSWFNSKKAGKQVAEPELARILKEFDPAVLA